MSAAKHTNRTKAPRRFKPYPAYQGSGVEWLDEIPADWEVLKVKRLCRVRRGASPRPIDDPLYFDEEGDYAWVRIADVTASERYLEQTTQRLSPLGKSKSVALEPGELFVSIAATVGKPVITKIKCCIHDGFVYFVGLHENREFLFYLFSCGEPYKGLGKLGTQLNLNTDTIGDIYLPQPSGAEQEKIVRFLDRETTRIDALVAKKERLIELLQEERTSLITRAVTKGLDPNVPMKNSGVEWLGEIPKHWKVKRLRHLIHRIEQGWSPDCENREAVDDEWGVLKAGCVNRGVFVEAEHKALPETLDPVPALEVQEGDLLMSRASGSRDLVGSVALVPQCRHRLLLCDKVFRLHLDPDEGHSLFLAYSMNSRIARWQIEIVLSGGNGLANNIAQGVVKDLIVAIPRREEQRSIASFLDQETARIDALVAKVREAIERVKELRTALISAAVTGKIDVREEVA